MDVTLQYLRWLIPDEACPCDIFLHFRGKYPLALKSGQPVSAAFLEKLAKAGCDYIYVRASDLPAWRSWQGGRRLAPTAQTDSPRAKGKVFGNKRAELLAYTRKALRLRQEDGPPELQQARDHALDTVKTACTSPLLDWYFERFHEPPDLFHHNARVAAASAAFAIFRSLLKKSDLDTLVFSALIHELDGDPAASMNTVVSLQTLSTLEKQKMPIPAEVLGLLRLHDELCSGKGFPSGKKKQDLPLTARIFSISNHFDHYLLKDGASRRAKLERARQLMTQRQADYDSDLWSQFWDFWSEQMELVP
jgi:hypothetical protein